MLAAGKFTYSALTLLRPVAEAVWDPDLVLAMDRVRSLGLPVTTAPFRAKVPLLRHRRCSGRGQEPVFSVPESLAVGVRADKLQVGVSKTTGTIIVMVGH